jgi:phospholipid/cholesterol/gamma-HCH transport system substrate-binding protein
MQWLRKVVTWSTLLVSVTVAVLFVRSRVTRETIGQGFATYAMFRDGSGLPPGSKVVIAGVQVGEVNALAIQEGLARVGMKLRDDVVIWDDAWAVKRATSLLGDSYIEILPGGPLDDGPADPSRRRLKSGEPIPHVLEGGSTEKVLRNLANAMPRVDSAMIAADRFLLDARRWVSGPFTDGWTKADAWFDEGAISGPLESVAAGAARLDEATASAAQATAGLDDQVLPQLDDTIEALDGATQTVVTANINIKETLGTARQRMDDIDPYLARANAVLLEYSGQTPPEQQGALARMINDDDLGDRIEEGTQSVADFTTGLNRASTWLGLRAELNVLAKAPRVYVIAEVSLRNDKFYLIELEKGPQGEIPHSTLSDQLGSDVWTLRTTQDDGVRFSLQWGKRIGNARFRFGLKSSRFGAGADYDTFHKRLRISADVFEADYADLPRVKLSASLQLFKYIYFTGGVDDLLNPGGYLPIAQWPAAQDVPRFFNEVRYGRDYFFGGMINISDADLASMLRIYGALLLAGLAPGP